MRIVLRILSAFVCVIALWSGAFWIVSRVDVPQARTVSDSMSTVQERVTSLPSQILSRFPALPGSTNPTLFAVVIENHEDARKYQSGLEKALMVQEFLVEGLISRFIALFDTRSLPRDIGPARSLRSYFLDGIKPWARTVYHAGGSPDALERVTEGEEFFARNLLYFDDENKKNGSLRKDGVPAPHDLFLTKRTLKDFLSQVPSTYLAEIVWPPYPIGLPERGEDATSIRVSFFNVLHTVYFEYLALQKKYKRTNGEVVSDAKPSNILILEVPIDFVGEYGRLNMTLTGNGQALLFHSGKLWKARWSRDSIEQPFAITDQSGNDLPFADGQIWMMVLPTLERLVWE